MNEINKIYRKSITPGEFARSYFNYLNQILNKIDTNQIDKLVKHFEKSRKNGNTIFILGNGGSATTATTMANDIGFDILKKTGTKKAFRLFSLTDNNAVITAIANDVGYENIFSNQLKIHFKKNDSVLIISASGNSKNLVDAAKWTKKNKGKIIGFLGFDGGKIKDYCDVCIHIPSNDGEYGPIEDAHLAINHILAHWFQNSIND